MTKPALLAAAVLFASPALAQPVPPVSDETIRNLMADGSELEIRLDGDLNGDGETDTVFVERGEEMRKLTVLVAYRTEVDMGHDPVSALAMDPYPVQGGPASLSIRNGVLIVEDLTGGTTAISSLHRFRYDPAARRMKLIGVDARLYSRTNTHGWSGVSWNLLTGDYLQESAELLETPTDSDYADPVTKRSKRPIKPVYMEDTPSAESLVLGE